MQKREMETKTKKVPVSRYLLTKLCNIFDGAFLFDVSIRTLTLTFPYNSTEF